MKKKRNSCGGFTLVELIVVLVILSILAAYTVPAMTKYFDRANERECAANRKALVSALEGKQAGDPAATMADVLAEHTDVTCPGGGSYAEADKQTVMCSRHGSSTARTGGMDVKVEILP